MKEYFRNESNLLLLLFEFSIIKKEKMKEIARNTRTKLRKIQRQRKTSVKRRRKTKKK